MQSSLRYRTSLGVIPFRCNFILYDANRSVLDKITVKLNIKML